MNHLIDERERMCVLDALIIMEEFIRQRIDCPPVGGIRILIEEKDQIIKKQQDDLKKLQTQIKTLTDERDYLRSLLSSEQM